RAITTPRSLTRVPLRVIHVRQAEQTPESSAQQGELPHHSNRPQPTQQHPSAENTRNTPITDPVQAQRPCLLTRNEPFPLQIELNCLRPPTCLCSAWKQVHWQLRHPFAVHLLTPHTLRPFWNYL